MKWITEQLFLRSSSHFRMHWIYQLLFYCVFDDSGVLFSPRAQYRCARRTCLKIKWGKWCFLRGGNLKESSMTNMANWRDLGRKFRINYKKLQNFSLLSTTCEKLWFLFTPCRNATYLLLCPAFALNTQMLYITQEKEHLPVSSIVPSAYINTQQIMSFVLY